MNFWKTLLNYLTQKSTWVGLFAIIAAVGITVRPELADAIITCLLGVFGLIQVIINERAGQKDDTHNN